MSFFRESLLLSSVQFRAPQQVNKKTPQVAVFFYLHSDRLEKSSIRYYSTRTIS